ncbi:GNAT family N-acetyltransferase [Dactylosporangium sp. NPDC006015]|uniref:GNAT family N-acetyltransferase n=1 Tax=Dactylosporangium sp. NPDC006015 TaxID=3154576 RepID=UPI0033A59E4A
MAGELDRATVGRNVGVLTLVTFPVPTGLRARIEDVVVDESARGHGAGAALIREALRLAETEGARSVDLTIRMRRSGHGQNRIMFRFDIQDYRPRWYNGRDGIVAAHGARLAGLELLEWTGGDMADGSIAVGLDFGLACSVIFNALDENGLEHHPPGPSYRRHRLGP